MYTYTHPLFFRLFSHMDHYPCAPHEVLIGYLFHIYRCVYAYSTLWRPKKRDPDLTFYCLLVRWELCDKGWLARFDSWNHNICETNLHSILKGRDITLPTKVGLVKAMFFPVVMYGCESWTINKAECWRIDVFELRCWRRLLTVPWTARRSNQSILKEISPE